LLRKVPKIDVRLPREAERLLLLDAFFFFLSSPEELLDEDPARAGVVSSTGAMGAATASPSVVLGATSVLFLGVEPMAVAGAASEAGLP
jgi:hypothetical protein